MTLVVDLGLESYFYGEPDARPLAVASFGGGWDGPNKPPEGKVDIRGLNEPVCLRDLQRSIKNRSSRHPQARAATAFHKLAQRHRLIVHSG